MRSAPNDLSHCFCSSDGFKYLIRSHRDSPLDDNLLPGEHGNSLDPNHVFLRLHVLCPLKSSILIYFNIRFGRSG